MNDKNDNMTKGLTEAQVKERMRRGEQNILPKSPGRSVRQIYSANLLTFFNLLNLAIAVVLWSVGSYRNTLFMGVVVCNCIIGLVQELRAKRIVDHLSILSGGQYTVCRDIGQGESHVRLPADQLVRKDKLILCAGEEVPADAKVISGYAELNEALLTGEANPVAKRAGDTLLSGSFVVAGEVTCILSAVGEHSFAAKLTKEAKKAGTAASKLMRDIKAVIRTVGALVLPVGVVLFAKSHFLLKEDRILSIEGACASMIGMIPEGLMLLTSIALAVGVIRLGQTKVLVQQIDCIENLARADVLCLDKTGTLTTGELRVKELLYKAADHAAIDQLCADYCAAVEDNNPTALALRSYFDKKPVRKAIRTLPFSSERKYSAVWFSDGAFTLGAPDVLSYQTNDALDIYRAQGDRVLCLCKEGEVLLQIILEDRLRENAKAVCDYFTAQEVKLIILSGDHPDTAAQIAKRAGVPEADRLIDCSKLSEEQLAKAAKDYTVFGRVTPQGKKTIVKALQKNGHTVAMTGDGVNDILAMKQADCSIALGGGADAARKAAQLVLLNGDFSAIPGVLLQGRRVIGNITRSASLFLTKTCFSFLLSVILLFLPYAYPFVPINLTLISSLMIGIPSFFLALEPNYRRMQGSFLAAVLSRCLPGGITAAAGVLFLMIYGSYAGYEQALIATLCTYLFGAVAYCNLLATCRFDKPLHLALMVGTAVLFIGAVLLLPGVFSLLPIHTVMTSAGVLLALLLPGAAALYTVLRFLTAQLKRKEKD